MPATITLSAVTAQHLKSFQASSGRSYNVDSYGQITIQYGDLEDALAAGFSFQTFQLNGGKQRLQLVAQRTGINGNNAVIGGSNPYLNMHTRHVCPYGADAVQIIWAGFYKDPSTNVETALLPSCFSASSVTLTGGTGYVVGEIMTYALTNTTGMVAARVMVTAVSGGVPTQWQLVDGGAYNTPLGSGASQASTTGSGTGATATFTWQAYGAMGRCGIEQVWNDQTFTGPNAVKAVGRGLTADGKIDNKILIPMGGLYISDVIPVDVAVGGAIGLRANFAYNTIYPNRNPMIAAYGASVDTEQSVNNSTVFDQTLSGTIGVGATKTIFQPIAIMGIPKTTGATFVAMGNSREFATASGQGSISNINDPVDVDGNVSWFEKSLSATVGKMFAPYSNFSKGGDRYALIIPASNPALTGRQCTLRALAEIVPTAVMLLDPVNDFINGVTVATVVSQQQQLINELKGLGVKYVFTPTCDPRVTSGNSFVDLAGQTLSAASPLIAAYNDLLRKNSGPSFDFIIDFGTITESSLGSGKWPVDGTANYATSDGTHCSSVLITQKAAYAASVFASKVKL